MERCPVCRRKLHHQSWHGEFGLEEYIYECKHCGNLDHWSYGNQVYAVDGWSVDFTCHNYITEEQSLIAEVNHVEFKLRVKMAREKLRLEKRKAKQVVSNKER